MAGLIAALFSGRDRTHPEERTNPSPGIGGYAMGPGPAGQSGFPGSTAATRTMRGRNARLAKVRSDTNTGWESGLGTQGVTRQVSYRQDAHHDVDNPRDTPSVTTPKGRLREIMQQAAGEFYGGPMQHTGPHNNTAGGTPMSPAQKAGGHSQRDTVTPWTRAQYPIGGQAPGSSNVRNQVAQNYKAVPGQSHTYRSAARADQAPVNPGGQATSGNVHPQLAAQDVTVPSRFVMPGAQTGWSVLRRMPYTGRGDGARGAQLSGQRYYGTGQQEQFWNAGQGNYGIARERGGDHKRPVAFNEPAPWTANFYDTTSEVGTSEAPGTPSQGGQQVYVSPTSGRASNATGRMH
jgi:hypothetical protein